MIKSHNLQAVLLKSKFTHYQWANFVGSNPTKMKQVYHHRDILETQDFLICLFLSISDICTSSRSRLSGYLPFACEYFPMTVASWFCAIMEKQF